ncbi:murein hydrolase activator EnvC family protein [Parageobacillus thermoglucosidasius]|uniref:murein hydrolase activator EnvC family protein n=1 Tax=Parageobacillus thermoglucosidasius TaxID=1426 RepID=UPI002E1B021C|nr:peptidoglycan DD-metalloendopeptidase family protein [Parageobacillus thermoglucosidasius]MED4913874.1 peptidoglycan DD-metalloendopeptidase family protein [Parageobacillus thermoglucosidasius]MED4943853.1 peptidoglycan DD-metalloendopeptidase family protein [Parageobacillus thermoglucosidasius]MED4983629.1 peptidoglycan DD-metalloendopeptidase family protein [Parageobacillus thermoglucosidasius]
MKRRKVMALAAATVLSIGVFPHFADAVSDREIQEKRDAINDIRSKQSAVQDKINNADQQIQQLQTQQKSLSAEIKKLDLAVEETSGKIRSLSADIQQTEQAVETLKREIAEVQARIEKRNEILKERVRSLQESGGVISYLEVLLGSQSFSDFIDRISAVTTIFEADKQIIREQQADKALKEKKEKELTDKLSRLQADLKELEQLKQTLNEQINQKNQLMANLKQKEQEHYELKMELAEEQELLKKQEAAVKYQLQQLIEKKRAEEAAKRRAAASHTSSSGSGSIYSGGSSSSRSESNVPPVTSGAFMRPANGPVTSGFGYRSFGGGEFHAGIDIGKRGAVVPVVATADGYVFRSYFSSSYGNVIFITHVINGQVYTTVYAHLEARLAGEGQAVRKGQVIGYMGNTGRSTGPHLHFELHRGQWNPAKSNAVNPLDYINF